MKKILLVFMSAAFVLFNNSQMFGQSNAASMGDLLTVAPSGPSDVIRNPALIPNQTVNNAFGFFYTYVQRLSGVCESDLYLNMNGTEYDSKVEMEEPKSFGMNSHLSYLKKFDKSALGFAVTSLDNDQYLYNEIETHLYATDGTIEILSDEINRENSFHPVFITSAGFSLSGNSTFGFQLLAKYSRISEERKRETVISSSNEETEKHEKLVNAIRGELGFGYLYRANDFQLGLLLRSGDFSWIKKEVKIDYNSETSITQLDSKASIDGKRTSGPSVSAGIYKRINTILAFGFESLFIFEYSYVDKDFTFIGNENRIETEEFVVKSGTSVSLKGGIELKLTQNMTFSTGTGFSSRKFERYQDENNSGRTMSSDESDYIYCTAGIGYSFSTNISIDIMAAYFFSKNKQMLYYRNEGETYTDERRHEISIKGNYIFTGMGIVLRF
ncbi:MAG: hypothetical protein JW864_07000 [Spirochaetes bacterium]|nr:hypothetical protein [Spirochaetota bacterium]